MSIVPKLPFLLGALMAVIVGAAGYLDGLDSQAVYIRMAVVMIVFFIIGSIIKNTLSTIQQEISNKRENELLEMQDSEKKQEE